jgi:hypothetical protein
MSAVSRILFVAHTGQVSGAEKVMLDLVSKGLDTGREVIVACPPGPLSDQLPSRAGHLCIAPLGLGGERGIARGIGGVRLLRRWWSAGRSLAPLAQVPGTRTVVNSMLALPAVRLARPAGGAAWLVHDTTTSTKQRVLTRVGRPIIRVAVAMSEAAAAPQRAAGVPVVVAKYGVAPPTRRLGGELHSPPVVGMLALLTPWKGHRVLLEAARTLGDVEVEFAGGHFPGDEDYVAELRARAGQPDLKGRVRFLGHMDAEAALSRWDAAISASVSPEAGPLSVLEAMSYGVPVIGSDHGGTSELLREGAGVLVPSGDPASLAIAIKRVLSDHDLRREISDRARRRAADDHNIEVTLPLLLTKILS